MNTCGDCPIAEPVPGWERVWCPFLNRYHPKETPCAVDFNQVSHEESQRASLKRIEKILLVHKKRIQFLLVQREKLKMEAENK